MDTSAWWTQQLAEFVASVSQCTTETEAARAAVERAAEALDADVAAIMAGGELLAAVGYAEGTEPIDELKRLRPAVPDARLEVPGVGWCTAAAAALTYPAGATLVLARRDSLTRQETVLLRGMARVAAMTMTMLRLLDHERAARDEVERLAREQAALRRAATLVARGALPDKVFAAVAREVGNVLPAADFAMVARYDAGHAVEVVGGWSRAGSPVLVGRRSALGGQNVSTLVFEHNGPARVDDHLIQGDEPLATTVREIGMRSSAGAPISVDGRLWGVIIVASTREQALPPGTEYQLAQFTKLIATTIANTQARQEVSALADEQAALRRVATLVAKGAPSGAVFDTVTEEVGRLLPVDVTLLCRYDPDGYVVRIGEWTRTADRILKGSRAPLGGRNVGSLVFATGRSARIDDFGDDAGPDTFAWHSAGLRSAVGAPISVEGRLWGLVVVISRSDEPLPANTEGRLTGFTELIATAIANAEANAELKASRARIVATADQTRRRIERDLHDGVQQRLVTLALEIRAAQAKVPDQLELTAELDHVADGLSSTLDELREFARGIHPAILAKGGLAQALHTLVRRSPVRVMLDMELREQLPEHVEVTAYYVISEALTNAAKHAKASAVHVRVESRGGVLRLDVGDDGVGGADPARGSGLIGLRDRVEATGGTYTMTSRRGKGTRLLVELPVRPL